MKQCLLGISRLNRVDRLSVVVGSWKLTEFKLAKKLIEVSSQTRWERRKRETSQRALLVDGEKCCKPICF